jgi:hypothetical protein
MASPRAVWKGQTRRQPVQPEELNGGSCRVCGRTADVLLPERKASLDPLMMLAMVGLCFFAPRSVVAPEVFFLGLVVCCSAIAVLNLRWRHRQLNRSIVVACEACRTVTAAGKSDGELARSFFRRRLALASAWRMALPAFLFLLAVCAGSLCSIGKTPRGTVLVLIPVSLAVLALSILRVTYFGPRRRWWVVWGWR